MLALLINPLIVMFLLWLFARHEAELSYIRILLIMCLNHCCSSYRCSASTCCPHLLHCSPSGCDYTLSLRESAKGDHRHGIVFSMAGSFQCRFQVHYPVCGPSYSLNLTSTKASNQSMQVTPS